MKAQVVDLQNNAVEEIELDDAVFAVEVREHLFWEVINWQRAKRRAGTHKVKGRTEVRGGGKKPWRQKGTGRARQGSIRASQWVGGGVPHGPTPRDYTFRMPKRKRREALKSALSQKFALGQVRVVDSLGLDAPKTRVAHQAMGALEATKALFVDVTTRSEEGVVHNRNLKLAVRNLEKAKYVAAEGVNVEDLLRYDVLVVSREAVQQIQEVLR